MNRRGFTLVELLVYIVLASIVVLIAGRTYVDSVRFRVATVNKLATYSGVNELSMILQEDLFRMGLKGQKTVDNPVAIGNGVYWNYPSDRSSFHHGRSGSFDTLWYKSATFDASGAVIDSFRVHWYVDANQVLWRAETSYVGTPRMELVRVLENVDTFQLDEGVYLGDSINNRWVFNKTGASGVFNLNYYELTSNASSISVADSAAGVRMYGFIAKTLSELALTTAVSGTTPADFPMVANSVYTVEIDVGFNELAYASFNPDDDYLSVTLRKNNGGTLEAIPNMQDAPYYMGGDKDVHTRSFEFTRTGNGTMQVTPVLRFVCTNSCNVSGSRIYVREMRIWEQNADQYAWRTTPLNSSVASDLLLKSRVKAFRATLTTRKNGETTTVRKVIPTPNNGV